MNMKDYLFRVMAVDAYIFLFLSLIAPNSVDVKTFHLMVCISIPFSVFSFLTFRYRLFSKHIWIRRTVVIAVAIVDILLSSYLFGYLQPTRKHYTAYGIVIIAYVLYLIFVYYLSDKIEKKNLEAINRKLRDNKEE